MIILKTIVKNCVNTNSTIFSSWTIMNIMYSQKWFRHPRGNEAREQMEIFLNALIDTGELERDTGIFYKMKGKALETLDKYKIENKRHSNNISTQRKIMLLTWIIAIAAAINCFNEELIYILYRIYDKI